MTLLIDNPESAVLALLCDAAGVPASQRESWLLGQIGSMRLALEQANDRIRLLTPTEPDTEGTDHASQ